MPKLFAASMMLGRGGLLLAASASAASFDPASFVAECAVAYWTMVGDGGYTQADQTGRGSDILFSGLFDDPSYAAGQLGEAWRSTGVGDYFFRASTADVQAGAGDLIVTAWVNPNTFPDVVPVAGKWGVGSLEYSLAVSDDGSPVFRTTSDGSFGTLALVSADPISDGEWSFIVARYDSAGGKISIRVNNGSVIEAARAGGVHVGASDFTMGTTQTDGTYFDGLVDDTLILKSADALSADDFDALCEYLWNGGAGRDLTALF